MAVNKVPVLKRCRSLGLELALVGVVVLFDRIGSGLKALLDPSSAQL